jgi:hypothetical protein
MKNIFFSVILISLLSACINETEKSDVEIKKVSKGNNSEEKLNYYGDSLIYYGNDCIEYFAVILKEIDACPKTVRLSSLIEYSPTRVVHNPLSFPTSEGTFFHITYEKNNVYFGYSDFFYRIGSDEFYSIDFRNDSIIINESLLYVMPFKNVEFMCGGYPMKSKYKNENAGIWIISDSVQRARQRTKAY